jgi:hypothetical protein
MADLTIFEMNVGHSVLGGFAEAGDIIDRSTQGDGIRRMASEFARLSRMLGSRRKAELALYRAEDVMCITAQAVAFQNRMTGEQAADLLIFILERHIQRAKANQ